MVRGPRSGDSRPVVPGAGHTPPARPPNGTETSRESPGRTFTAPSAAVRSWDLRAQLAEVCRLVSRPPLCSPTRRPPGGPAHSSCRRPIPTPSHSCFPQEIDSWAPGCHGDRQMRAAGLGLRLARGRRPPPGEAGPGARLYKGLRGSALGRGRRGRPAARVGRGAGRESPERGGARGAASAPSRLGRRRSRRRSAGSGPFARPQRAGGPPERPGRRRSLSAARS